MKIVIMGAPGAGKGTQATKLTEILAVPHISTGDIFRYNIKNNTELGQKANEYIHQGQLVPDGLTEEIVKDRLLKSDCEKGFILDGFPRTIAQAKFLGNFLQNNQSKLDKALNILADDELIIRRISGRRVCKKCGAGYHIEHIPTLAENICDVCGDEVIQRDDDMPETVKKRLETYHRNTEPLVTYYSQQGLLVNVNGEQGIEGTTKQVLKVLGIDK